MLTLKSLVSSLVCLYPLAVHFCFVIFVQYVLGLYLLAILFTFVSPAVRFSFVSSSSTFWFCHITAVHFGLFIFLLLLSFLFYQLGSVRFCIFIRFVEFVKIYDFVPELLLVCILL